MKPQIQYLFKSSLVLKRLSDGKFDFIEHTKEFYNDEPIIARKEALEYYRIYLSYFQNPQNWENKTDKEIREEVKKYINPDEPTTISIGDEKYEIDSMLNNEVGVYLVWDNPNHKEMTLDDSENDYDDSIISREDYVKITNLGNPEIMMIHGIGGMAYPESLMLSLETEYNIYKENNYQTEDYKTTVVFCDSDLWLEGYRDDEPSTYTILKTPFDWTGMDKPYWWGEPSEEDEIHEQESATDVKTWEEIIAGGENNQVEFKPALLFNHLTGRAGISIKGIIAKSICGFLNARGGFLFIGMNDDGTPQGLSHDFSLAGDKAPRDFFRLEFDDTIKQFLPESMPLINGQFITIEGIEIFVVIVFPSKRKPVFMKGQHGKEFWVRWTASTRQIVDNEEIANYCLEHWGNKT